MAKREIITTCTRDCPGCCGLLAVAEGGKVVALKGNPDHPLNQGQACAKASRYLSRVYSPERVLRPMRRKHGVWREVSWDQALDEWAGRIKDVVGQSGPEAILHYQGYGERTALKLLNARFFAHLGGATTLAGTLCSGTAFAAMAEDFGERISHDPLDLENSQTVILWGRNPVVTQFNIVGLLHRVRQRGGQIWLVDPAATESLALGHRHIQIAPGADVYLALGAAKVILGRGLADEKFIQENSKGFAAFKALLDDFNLPDLAHAAGVAEKDLEDLAQIMVQGSPTAILLGWGLHRHYLAHQGVRAMDALSALSGNVGRPGGGVSQGFEEYGPYDQSVWGQDLHPSRRQLLMPRIGAQILAAAAPPIRMIVVSAANPACMAPDSATVAQAFGRAEFVVHLGHFQDDTADLADLFLPCATFLEETDIVAAYGHNYLGPVNQAMAPLGLCRSQFDIYQDLAGRFPFASSYQKPLGQWLEIICRPFLAKGFSLDEIMAGPVRDPKAPMCPWRDKIFATPSGKFRFMGELKAPVPPDPAYPLALLTTGSPKHLCSELTLAEHDPLPEARVHPDTAQALGLMDRSRAFLESPQGRVLALVRHDPGQRPDVCLCRRGGWVKAGHGLNRLIPDTVSALGAGTPFYQARVRLVPVDTGPAKN